MTTNAFALFKKSLGLPEHPPRSQRDKIAKAHQDLEAVENQVVRAERNLAAANDPQLERRYDRRLQRLLRQQEKIEAWLAEAEDATVGWRWTCPVCGGLLSQSESDYDSRTPNCPRCGGSERE